MGVNICVREIGRYLDEKFIKRNRSGRSIVYISRKFFVKTKERIWRR